MFFFARPWPFHCEKSIVFIVCEKCLQVVSFLEKVLTKDIALLDEKNEARICFAKNGRVHLIYECLRGQTIYLFLSLIS
jgi:hypothetical protein